MGISERHLAPLLVAIWLLEVPFIIESPPRSWGDIVWLVVGGALLAGGLAAVYLLGLRLFLWVQIFSYGRYLDFALESGSAEPLPLIGVAFGALVVAVLALVADYQRTQVLFPFLLWMLESAVDASIPKGRSRSGTRWARSMVRLYPKQPRAWFARARAAWAFESPAETEAILWQAIECHPDDLSLRDQLAWFLAAEGRMGEARGVFELMSRVHSAQPWGHVGLAWMALRDGDHETARSLAERAEKMLDPSYPGLITEVALLWAKLFDEDRAREVLKPVNERGGTWTSLALMGLLIEETDPEQARLFFERAKRLWEGHDADLILQVGSMRGLIRGE